MALKTKKMNRLAWFAAVLVLFAFGMAYAAEETVEEILRKPPLAPTYTNRDLDLNRRVVSMLCQFHYAPATIDAKRSSRFFLVCCHLRIQLFKTAILKDALNKGL